ncbi:MAG: hypothetical protein K8T20_15145 [Planctomycetes bacterium]|nr:hypothetical protein [Planctomycetota bacterium]
MDNPFLKRATEHLRDAEAFLGIVSPEPVRYFLAGHAKAGVLYDRLVLISGTPGSGKTTLARLFELPMLAALLRNSEATTHKPLLGALAECEAVRDGRPTLLACRLSLESDYREIWEFPYSEELRLALTLALIQARAVLTWLRHLETCGVNLEHVSVRPLGNAEGAVAAIGGTSARAIVERGRRVERALYQTVAALIAPPLEKLDPDCTTAYQPFDVIEGFQISAGAWAGRTLLPLVVLDDAHTLHPAQFAGLRNRLARRELRVARWIVTRLDVLQPAEALEAATRDCSPLPPLPGISAKRDITEITLQSAGHGETRRKNRMAFRSMARDMADRYLRLMPLFATRKLERFSDLLTTQVEPLADAELARLAESVNMAQSRLGIGDERRRQILEEVDRYAKGEHPEEIRLAMLIVLMHRYMKRVPQGELFGKGDPEPARPLTADLGVYDAACIRLLHEHKRPYFYGMEDLCDAATENAEQFLHLAARLVDESAANIVRSRRPSLDAATQSRLLRARADEIFRDWNFPHVQAIKYVVTQFGARLLARSLEPNAPLDAGANAYGILQTEFDAIPKMHPEVARVLQYGVAYRAFTLVPRYSCKHEEWCLLELGGVPLLHFGLTLKRGGFVEGSVRELARMISEAR